MTEPAQSVDELIARNFAANVEGELAAVPDNIEKVRRPLPPVGHFGYTEEDADKVRKENKRAGATLDVSEAKWTVSENSAQGDPVEPAHVNTERAERAARESEAADRAAAEGAGPAGAVAEESASDRGDATRKDAGAASRREDSRSNARTAQGPSRRATDKNKQQPPAGQSRAGAESKGDDGDNTNNPTDRSEGR